VTVNFIIVIEKNVTTLLLLLTIMEKKITPLPIRYQKKVIITIKYDNGVTSNYLPILNNNNIVSSLKNKRKELW